MPLLTKRELLRRARELMNHDGLHWAQGDFVIWDWVESKQKEVERFCSLGSLQKILMGDGEACPVEGTQEYGLYMEAVTDLVRVINRRWPNIRLMHPTLEDVSLIVHWNDDPERTWDDVNSVFSELALEKAKKASSSVPTS